MGKTLNEMANLFPKAGKLIESWEDRINLVSKVAGAPLAYEKKVVLAQCLENTNLALQALNEATDSSDAKGFKHYALDLVTAIVPNLVANDLVSVQPIDNEVGVINYIKYIYGNDKGAAKKGDEFASALLYQGSDTDYSSQKVSGEALVKGGTNKLTGSLAWRPILKGTIKVALAYTATSGTKSVIITDAKSNAEIAGFGLKENANVYDGKLKAVDAEGNIVEGLLADTSKIDYATGSLVIELTEGNTLDANTPLFTVDYEYDQKSVGDGAIGSNQLQVPEVEIKIATMPVVCQSRKLKALYAFDAAFKLQKEYGSDINALLNTQIASEITHEIDNEICTDLLVQAGLVNDTWSSKVPDGISLKDHYEGFIATIVKGQNKIFGATKRATANFMIVGLDVASVLEVMPGFKPVGPMKGVVGPHIMGTIGNLTVVKNPYFPANKYVLGYKGTSLFDAGYFYCPYMPVMTTQLLMLDDFVGRKGWATEYAKKMVQPLLYCSGEIVNN